MFLSNDLLNDDAVDVPTMGHPLLGEYKNADANVISFSTWFDAVIIDARLRMFNFPFVVSRIN